MASSWTSSSSGGNGRSSLVCSARLGYSPTVVGNSDRQWAIWGRVRPPPATISVSDESAHGFPLVGHGTPGNRLGGCHWWPLVESSVRLRSMIPVAARNCPAWTGIRTGAGDGSDPFHEEPSDPSTSERLWCDSLDPHPYRQEEQVGRSLSIAALPGAAAGVACSTDTEKVYYPYDQLRAWPKRHSRARHDGGKIAPACIDPPAVATGFRPKSC